MICHARRFIFIHVPKAAGTSIKDALGQALYGGDAGPEFQVTPNYYYPPAYTSPFEEHITARELRERLPAQIWEGYFKFAFVRHPLDWAMSNYAFFLRDRPDHPAHAFLQSLGFAGSMAFLFGSPTRPRIVAGMRFSQWEFVCDEHGELLVDFIGKHEHLERDFAAVCQRLGLPPPALPHLNRTCRDADYRSGGDPAVERLLQRGLERDFQLFGYPAPPENS